jgi:hypothetical protein
MNYFLIVWLRSPNERQTDAAQWQELGTAKPCAGGTI